MTPMKRILYNGSAHAHRKHPGLQDSRSISTQRLHLQTKRAGRGLSCPKSKPTFYAIDISKKATGYFKAAHIQLLLAHQSVKRKNTASTIDAILLAFVLNPHAIKHAPMNEDPRYPAGRVNHGIPPDIAVEPPSSAVEFDMSA